MLAVLRHRDPLWLVQSAWGFRAVLHWRRECSVVGVNGQGRCRQRYGLITYMYGIGDHINIGLCLRLIIAVSIPRCINWAIIHVRGV